VKMLVRYLIQIKIVFTRFLSVSKIRTLLFIKNNILLTFMINKIEDDKKIVVNKCLRI